jgi:hypothetical protein
MRLVPWSSLSIRCRPSICVSRVILPVLIQERVKYVFFASYVEMSPQACANWIDTNVSPWPYLKSTTVHHIQDSITYLHLGQFDVLSSSFIQHVLVLEIFLSDRRSCCPYRISKANWRLHMIWKIQSGQVSVFVN